MSKERRNFYRIHYPSTKSAILSVCGVDFEIINLSETGAKAKFSHDFKKLIKKNSSYEISIQLIAGEGISLVGKVLRVKKDELVFSFESSIPYELIMKEQRYLIQYRLKIQGQNINQE